MAIPLELHDFPPIATGYVTSRVGAARIDYNDMGEGLHRLQTIGQISFLILNGNDNG